MKMFSVGDRVSIYGDKGTIVKQGYIGKHVLYKITSDTGTDCWCYPQQLRLLKKPPRLRVWVDVATFTLSVAPIEGFKEFVEVKKKK